jgi:hypothetical protein
VYKTCAAITANPFVISKASMQPMYL